MPRSQLSPFTSFPPELKEYSGHATSVLAPWAVDHVYSHMASPTAGSMMYDHVPGTSESDDTISLADCSAPYPSTVPFTDLRRRPKINSGSTRRPRYTLTAAQRERKREHDRLSQRAYRQRQLDQVDTLQRRVSELEDSLKECRSQLRSQEGCATACDTLSATLLTHEGRLLLTAEPPCQRLSDKGYAPSEIWLSSPLGGRWYPLVPSDSLEIAAPSL